MVFAGNSSFRVRFAPSPSGLLHIGNLRTALINYLFVRASGGEFLLRLDDTDTTRCKPEYDRAISLDLHWLGMGPDGSFRQSERMEQYRQAALQLQQSGLLYPCYETPEELERRRRLAMAGGRSPVYDRAALELGQHERAKLEEQGRRPHWRFRLSGQRVSWVDLVRGEQSIDTASVSDPVLIRADGSYLYTLPSVFDDIDKEITHLVRGEDHVTNSGVQIEIFRALSAEPPQMAHLPLMTDDKGGALSKRLASLSLAQLRDDGIEPMALLSMLARLGTSDPVRAETSIAPLIEGFDFTRIGRAPVQFSMTDLQALNADLLRQASYESVLLRLGAMPLGRDHAGPEFWSAIAPNISRLDEARLWLERLFGPETIIDMPETDRQYVRQAAELLPEQEAFGSNTWQIWTSKLAATSGRKGRDLFMPLRLALTGSRKGPEMNKLLQLLGRDRAMKRLLCNSGKH